MADYGLIIKRDNGTDRINMSKRLTRVLNNGQPFFLNASGSHTDPALAEGTPWWVLPRDTINYFDVSPYIWFEGTTMRWTYASGYIIYGVY